MGADRTIITVFGSAAPQPETSSYAAAYELGARLAEAGFTVCNGGYGGTMEASARGAKSAGGSTIGIITDFYRGKEPNRWIDSVVRTATAQERLLALIQAGDAYVVLPGGTGTLLELAAVWEFMNKGVLNPRPCVLLGEVWHSVVQTVRRGLRDEGRTDAARLISLAGTAEECAALITQSIRRTDDRP